MKTALVLTIAIFSLATTTFAQAPDADTSPGPHNPNPPMAAPDLRLPPPCAPIPNLAAAGVAKNPGAAATPVARSGQVLPIGSAGETQCSANGTTQSAQLPGLAPAAQ
jgi:hypothetical protein